MRVSLFLLFPIKFRPLERRLQRKRFKKKKTTLTDQLSHYYYNSTRQVMRVVIRCIFYRYAFVFVSNVF